MAELVDREGCDRRETLRLKGCVGNHFSAGCSNQAAMMQSTQFLSPAQYRCSSTASCIGDGGLCFHMVTWKGRGTPQTDCCTASCIGDGGLCFHMVTWKGRGTPQTDCCTNCVKTLCCVCKVTRLRVCRRAGL